LFDTFSSREPLPPLRSKTLWDRSFPPHDVIGIAAVALARRPDWLYLNKALW